MSCFFTSTSDYIIQKIYFNILFTNAFLLRVMTNQNATSHSLFMSVLLYVYKYLCQLMNLKNRIL